MTRKLTQQEFEKKLKKVHGDQFTVLSDYHGMNSKIKVRCDKCNWIGEARADLLLDPNYGAQCPSHDHKQYNSSSFQKAINQIQDNQYVLLSKFVNTRTKVKIKCNICGKELYVWPDHLLDGRIGKNCNHRIYLNFEQASKRLNRIFNGEIKLVHFSGMGYAATFEHLKCGNTWQTRADVVFHKISGCPYCSTVSKGEKAVAEYLKENEISFKPQFTFPNCKDQRMLPFDFAMFNRDGSLNSLIEYQGCQHFMDISQYKKGDFFGKEPVSKTQKHDKMKSAFCKEHEIQLIQINHPQDTSKSNKYSFITNLVQRVLDKELKVN